jgi:hypothetical protein
MSVIDNAWPFFVGLYLLGVGALVGFGFFLGWLVYG